MGFIDFILGTLLNRLCPSCKNGLLNFNIKINLYVCNTCGHSCNRR